MHETIRSEKQERRLRGFAPPRPFRGLLQSGRFEKFFAPGRRAVVVLERQTPAHQPSGQTARTSSDNPYDRRGDEQRRSFNPNFTKDNRLKSGSRDRDDRPYGKPKYGANRDDRYNRENRGDRFDKDDRYRKNDRFEREDRPQRDGNRYNKDDRFNRNDRPTGSTKTTATVKRPARTRRPAVAQGRPASGPYKPQRRDESQPYGLSVRVSRKTATAKAVSVKNGIEATAPVGREPTTPDSKKTGKKIIRATTLPNRRALSA